MTKWSSVSELKQQEYYKKVLPYAKVVAERTGVPAPIVASWWSWETNFGSNPSSKHNNHAGIKSNSSGRDYVTGQYSGYNSIDNFTNDYIRLLSWNAEWTGYPEVIRTAKKTSDVKEITKAMNASAWAEQDYNVNEIALRVREINQLSIPDGTVILKPDSNNSGEVVNDLKQYLKVDGDLTKYTAVGLLVAVMISLIKD